MADSPTFTPREHEIIHFIAEGLTTGEIAARLGIRPKTVSTHRENIRRKLGDGDIADLTRMAIARGWASA